MKTNSKKFNELTRAEEQVMHILWDLEKGFVKDVVERFEEPRPAYNTVSTIIRILEKKGFVSYTPYGNTYEYYPLISREEYTASYLNRFIGKYFSNSYKELVSFFTANESLSIGELEEMKRLMDEMIQKKKKP
ncbi:MAG TPA: BlaI/MecI/CopY family transcriptional regulator [Bacteroidales bacterium]|nr:BlaI/MecI/CopY family transcriptional regulator [Bacteroidales bacterium]